MVYITATNEFQERVSRVHYYCDLFGSHFVILTHFYVHPLSILQLRSQRGSFFSPVTQTNPVHLLASHLPS